jgi:hypothetical protein
VPDETCPSCGNRLPPEIATHALAPAAGLVSCPHCGAAVTLPKPGGAEEPQDESFAGHETVEGVMQELRDKEDG